MRSFDDFRGQSAHIGQLHEDFARGTNVHAYLFAGPKGTGKRSVAQLCVMTALCRGQEKPCGVCGPCRRVLGGAHPDVHFVLPEKGKKSIGVDVIREAIAEVGVSAFEAGGKAMLIPDAERMTPQAQNCLLKTLEEPPQGTVFFLITDQPGALLPTIISRCRVVRFHPLSTEEAAARLCALGLGAQDAQRRARLAGGCVGQALDIDEGQMELRLALSEAVFSVRSPGGVLAVVNAYKDDKERQAQVMDAVEGIVRDILAAQAGGAPIEEAGYAPQAEAYAKKAPLESGLALQRAVMRARMMLGSNVAFASAFESILLKVSEEYTRWSW
ncbi:MAG: DNA polymerase III subunit delta' [Clostridia bacterium]|nr:DNA polymerase III subunit delta' [Clostridia bacterium]